MLPCHKTAPQKNQKFLFWSQHCARLPNNLRSINTNTQRKTNFPIFNKKKFAFVCKRTVLGTKLQDTNDKFPLLNICSYNFCCKQFTFRAIREVFRRIDQIHLLNDKFPAFWAIKEEVEWEFLHYSRISI
jgi:hypothetical protein